MKQPQQLEFNLTAELHDLLAVICNRRLIRSLQPKPTETGLVLPFKKIEASHTLKSSTVSLNSNLHSSRPEPIEPIHALDEQRKENNLSQAHRSLANVR